MGTLYILLLTAIAVSQSIMFFNNGCFGGRPGAPYICEKETALVVYIVFTSGILVMLVLLVRSEMKKRKASKSRDNTTKN